MGYGLQRSHIETLIRRERVRQTEKWGLQNHDNFKWNAILGEEIGEVANAILEDQFNSGPGHAPDHIAVELIQSIAVAVAWLECLDRQDSIKLSTLSLNA